MEVRKNMLKIMFKSMEEGKGAYSISNKGHIRSYIGKPKILKLDSRNSYLGVIALRTSVGKRQRFSVSRLMKKYWPDIILESPVSSYIEKRKLLVLSLEEISQICGFMIKYNKVTTTNGMLRKYIDRAVLMLTEDEKLGFSKR